MITITIHIIQNIFNMQISDNAAYPIMIDIEAAALSMQMNTSETSANGLSFYSYGKAIYDL